MKNYSIAFSRLSRVESMTPLRTMPLWMRAFQAYRDAVFTIVKSWAERRFKTTTQYPHTPRRRRCVQKETTTSLEPDGYDSNYDSIMCGRWPTINNQPLVVQMNNQAPTESSLRLPGGNESICSFSILMVDDHRWYHNQSTLLECSVECQATIYLQG